MMMTPCQTPSLTPSQRLARAMLHAWTNGDLLALAAAVEQAQCEASGEERDIVDLLKGISTKMRGWMSPMNHDELQASLKLLHHLARSRA